MIEILSFAIIINSCLTILYSKSHPSLLYLSYSILQFICFFSLLYLNFYCIGMTYLYFKPIPCFLTHLLPYLHKFTFSQSFQLLCLTCNNYLCDCFETIFSCMQNSPQRVVLCSHCVKCCVHSLSSVVCTLCATFVYGGKYCNVAHCTGSYVAKQCHSCTLL